MGWPYDPQQEETCPACGGEDWCRHCKGSGVVRDRHEAARVRKDLRDEWYEDHGPDDPPEVDESRLP